MDLTQFSYYDRRSGQVKQDPIYARGLAGWLYNSALGWFLIEFLLSRRWVSRLYGWLKTCAGMRCLGWRLTFVSVNPSAAQRLETGA
jgi:hypothetical protein